jgi:hypothetical protein
MSAYFGLLYLLDSIKKNRILISIPLVQTLAQGTDAGDGLIVHGKI